MEDFRRRESTTRSLREEIQDLRDTLEYSQGREVTNKKKKGWRMPMGWKGTINKAKKERNKVLVFYLDMKGRMEKPRLLPILSGDVVMIKNKAYDANPMAMWTLGKKGPKALIIREIDRRPVSNLDYENVKKKGFGTDSDEILIKATMKAIQGGGVGSRGNIALVVIGIIVLLVVIFTLSGGGTP